MKLKHRSRDEEVADRVVTPDFVCRDPSGKEDFALELVFNGEVFEVVFVRPAADDQKKSFRDLFKKGREEFDEFFNVFFFA